MTGGSRLSMSVTHADGRVTRWGPDEPNPTDIPGDLTFSTAIPGGFRDMSCSLLRRIDVEYPDQALYDTVRVYGPGNQTVWEGRMQQFPRQHGSGFQITPGAVGWSAHLRDDPSFREIYVDRDMSQWNDSPLTRRDRLASVLTVPTGDVPVTVGAGGISWAPSSSSALPTGSVTEIQYDAGAGLLVGRIEYKGKRNGAFTNFDAPAVVVDVNENLSSGSSETLTLDDTHRVATTFTDGRYAMLRTRVNAATTPAAGSLQSYDRIIVIGVHGASLTNAGGVAVGVLASNVLTDVITRVAPLLSTSAIDASSFAIPHLVFRDPVTAEDAILAANAYELWDWGVYDDREFFYRQPDPDRLTWEARLSDGAQIDLEGDTADSVYNGVLVSYTDPTGKRQVVGPPAAYWPSGTALADTTSAALVDTDATNPLNAHDIPRRWGKLEISFPTNSDGATQLGVVWLAERRLASRRGSLKLTGTVAHPTEGQVPVWRVRAGDYIRIADHPADVPRKIISTTYTHTDSGLSCDLDNTPNKIDAIMERIGVRQVGVF